jgi:histidinol dehydrogenase
MRPRQQRSFRKSSTISRRAATPQHWSMPPSSTSIREIILNDAEIEAASAKVPEKLKRDIEFAHANVKRFAEAQTETVPEHRG